MVKIGIIGSGFGLYGLLPAFISTKGCKVVSICGKKSERLVNYCNSIGLKKIYTDWQEMLDNEKLDALAIAVAPIAQYQIAKVALNKNLHIWAEKPLAVTEKQAKELLTLAEKKKIKHIIDFLFPEIEQWKKVKQLLNDKKYGKLKQICLNWDFLSYDIKNKKTSWKTNVSQGGGALSLYFPHSLYYLEYFAGKIINFNSRLIYSKESLNGGEVGVDLLVKFEKGVTGYTHLSCNTPGLNKHQLIFICEKGTIILEMDQNPSEEKNSFASGFIIKIYADGQIKQLSVPEKINLNSEDERVRVVKKLTARFIDSIIHDKNIIPSFKEGVRVQELIEKIRVENV